MFGRIPWFAYLCETKLLPRHQAKMGWQERATRIYIYYSITKSLTK